jgi:AcrR family transcriptional regulator
MSKGAKTRERIVEKALVLAARGGVLGLTIGGLAEELGMSKSGLFAHFGSKEELQLAVLETSVAQFTAQVFLKAFLAPRGVARLKRMFKLWVEWHLDRKNAAGCLFLKATVELDDTPGRPQQYLLESQRDFLMTLERAAKIAIAEGQFKKNTNCEQFAFELYGIILSFNSYNRLLKDKKVKERAQEAFDRLMRSCLAAAE